MNADLTMHKKLKGNSDSSLHETKIDLLASGLEDEEFYFSDQTDGESDQNNEDDDDFDQNDYHNNNIN